MIKVKVLLTTLMVFFLFLSTLKAQKQKLSLTVKAAPVLTKLSVKPQRYSGKEILQSVTTSSAGTGYNVGLAVDIPIYKRLYNYAEIRRSAWNVYLNLDDNAYLASIEDKYKSWEIIPLCAKYKLLAGKSTFYIGAGLGLTYTDNLSRNMEVYQKEFPEYKRVFSYQNKAGTSVFVPLSLGISTTLNSNLSFCTSAEFDRNIVASPTQSIVEGWAPVFRYYKIECLYNLFALNFGLKYSITKK